MTRPLLLIDVDGPLNPYVATPNTMNKFNRKNPDKRFEAHKLLNFKVRLTPWHGEELTRLADLYDLYDLYDLVWCTTWEHDANSLIAPRIGLTELPVIEFDKHRLPSRSDGTYFKTHNVVRYAAGRPFAWIDDEISTWDSTYVEKHHDGPSNLMFVDPVTGLTNEHFNALTDWADTLTPAEES